uniref:Ubiquinol oxidase n=1 Tax=Leptocylindrus danicus TaxID=163516 RepID=A0A7S2LGM5_9STRA|mmetsp:Transcript_4839/g.7035  ORF Transcript_4839/g.7035 Transcript_4839/m.7035 type:complete len:472 (+) Transcript_4839:71-1486(+)
MLLRVLSMTYFALFASVQGFILLKTPWPEYKPILSNACKIRSKSTGGSFMPFAHLKKDSSIRMTKQLKGDLQHVLEKQGMHLVHGGHLLDLPLGPFFSDANVTSGAENERLLALDRSILASTSYGFVSRSAGSEVKTVPGAIDEQFEGYPPPGNVFELAAESFERNLRSILADIGRKDVSEKKPTREEKKLQAKLKQLTLNSTAIWIKEDTPLVNNAHPVIKIPYVVICYLLDVLFVGQYVPARFFYLETVARMPYFSYISMLHLYETLGWWRRSAEAKRVHFAEEWNEFHHLLIMESLGGDQSWAVRFLAQHSAIIYYWVLVLLWLVSPTWAYKFSELLETHAVHTYSQFLDDNEALLKELPPPLAAVEYYTLGTTDPLFQDYKTPHFSASDEEDEFESRKSSPGENMTSLYYVFENIRNDEGEHVNSMKACLDPNIAVMSKLMKRVLLAGFSLAASVGYVISGTAEDIL